MRYHNNPGRKLFQPAGAATCPVNIDQIGEERTTHVQFVGGASLMRGGTPRMGSGTSQLNGQAEPNSGFYPQPGGDATHGDVAATQEHWLNDVLKDTLPHPGWLSLVTVRNGRWLTVKAITSLAHGGRPAHFERLKTDKKQMKNAPHIQKNDILYDTWCACYVSRNLKKNNEANTMIQVEFLRQNGKKARTKFSVPGSIGTCFEVLVSFHEPVKERPTLVLACAEIKNHFAKVKGTGKINLMTIQSSSVQQGFYFLHWGWPGTDSMSPKVERRCARLSRRRSFSGSCSMHLLRSCTNANTAGPSWSCQQAVLIGMTGACSTLCQDRLQAFPCSWTHVRCC